MSEYDRGNKKKRWANKAVAKEKHLVSQIGKQFEGNGEQSSSIQGKNAGVVVLVDTPLRTLNRLRMTLFNPFAIAKDKIEPAPSGHSLPCKRRPTSPKGLSSSGTPRALRSHARGTIPTAEELLEGVCKLSKT